jgi:hypothetical protein
MAQSMTRTIGKEMKQALGIRALSGGVLTSRMILTFLLAIVVFVGCALLIVWTRDQVIQLGYQINTANVALSSLRQENRKLVNRRYELLNLPKLARQSAKLGLVKPKSEQILVIYEKTAKSEN